MIFLLEKNCSFNVRSLDGLHQNSATSLYHSSWLAGSSSQAEMDSCVSYLRFPVSHSMAPLSHLLVYYVRENGEGVTDSLQIPIQPDFENQVRTIFKYELLLANQGNCATCVSILLQQQRRLKFACLPSTVGPNVNICRVQKNLLFFLSYPPPACRCQRQRRNLKWRGGRWLNSLW